MKYEYWLASLRKIPTKKKKLLREWAGNAEKLYHMDKDQIQAWGILSDMEFTQLIAERTSEKLEEYERITEKDIRFIPCFSKEYPKRLRKIADPPYALYVKGKLPDDERTSAAIVGARRCTPYGEQMALEYGEALARCGIQIISGMARGIDGAGQRGALNGGGETFGVLGCGVDICYPRENIGLYMDIQKCGGVLSEQRPQEHPIAGFFPARNRIISALSDVVLIMEAKERSGSLITADLALEQGKDVYALPGLVTSQLSQGCHRLIWQGAGILISPDDLLDEMGICHTKVGQKKNKNEKTLESTENLVYSCLGFTPKGVDSLIEESSLTAREVMETLMTLKLAGMIKEISKNYYIRI